MNSELKLASDSITSLDAFCNYQQGLNDWNDLHEGHWDLVVYLTGLDLWASEGSFNTLGTLGVKVRNMKMDFTTGGTWHRVGP